MKPYQSKKPKHPKKSRKEMEGPMSKKIKDPPVRQTTRGTLSF
jgi:hypothetical protein